MYENYSPEMIWYTGIGCTLMGLVYKSGWLNYRKNQEESKESGESGESKGAIHNIMNSVMRATPFFIGLSAGVYFGLMNQ